MQTTVTNERNNAMRSLSPHDKPTTVNKTKHDTDTKQSQTIIIDIQDQKKDRRASNDQIKARSPNDKKVSININLKKESESKKLFVPGLGSRVFIVNLKLNCMQKISRIKNLKLICQIPLLSQLKSK